MMENKQEKLEKPTIITLNSDEWGFTCDGSGNKHLFVPKKKSFALTELIYVMTALNDLWKILLQAVQVESIQNEHRKILQ